MPTRETTLTTHTTKPNGKRTRPQARKAKKKNGNGTNGNGQKALAKADLQVLCAELTQQNLKLTQAVTAYKADFDALHKYLDCLHVPTTPNDSEEAFTLPERVVAGVKLWFKKRGGVDSSDHVSSTLRAMMREAGEWRCLYPQAYPDEGGL